WDVMSGKEVCRLGRHFSSINTVSFSRDGKYAVAGYASQPRMVTIPAAAHRNRQSDLFQASGRSDDSTMGREHRTIRMWETTSGDEVSLFSYGKTVNSLSFSPDGRQLLSAGRQVILWDVASGQPILTIDAKTDFTACAAFSLDGKY